MRKIAPTRIFILAVLIVLCAQVQLHAQTKVTDKKGYVTATIDPNNQGLITIRRAPGTNLDPILSYPQKSFLSVMVGDRIFTNNKTGTNIGNDPRFGGYLDNGITVKIADTIRTTWPNKNGCDIIQEVYPVSLEASGQIVMRWKLKNNQPNTPMWGQAQFLLDLQVGGQTPNDGAPVLTRYGYRPIWEQYNSASTYGIPWFFAAFENKLPNPPTFDPGITGVGYIYDVNYNLGLKKPTLITFGDWQYQPGVSALVDFLWGVSTQVQWGSSYTDAAVLYQWEGIGVAGGKTAELSRTSYGTGEFGTCTGQLFGIVFYPRYFKWDGASKYLPDPANIEFYAFDVYSPLPQDPNYGPPSAGTHLKLHVGPNLQIIDPVGDPKIQRQMTGPANGYIPQYGVGTAFWTIKPDKAINCVGTKDSWLKFTAESSLGGTGPIFFNSGDGDTCEHFVKIDCVQEDFIAPLVSNETEVKTFPFKKTFDVSDNRPKDKGLDKVSWVATPGSGTDISNFTITVNPPLEPCSPKKHTYTITQIDSTKGGCFDFTFIDCALNDTTHSVCIPAHPLIPTPDTLNPVVTVIEHINGDPTAPPCNGRCDSLQFTELRQYDVGLESIVAKGIVNMKFDALNVPFGAKKHLGKVCVVDTMLDGTITLDVYDTIGNVTTVTYTYCTVHDTIPPDVRIDKLPTERGWAVTVTELNPWDRAIDSIAVINPINVKYTMPFISKVPGSLTYATNFNVYVVDSTKDASFCVEAKDLRDLTRNWSARVCANSKADPDVYPPTFVTTPALGPNVTKIDVIVHDYHVNQSGDTLGWDKGIDEIWFSVPRGIKVPAPMKLSCPMVAPSFTLTVEDTLNVDSITCITIYARDCAGNVGDTTWCYPYEPDALPPILRVAYASRTQLTYTVADSQLYDRGLKLVALKNEVNFSPVSLDVNRIASLPGTINRAQYSSSSVGTLEAVDYWGTLNVSPTVRAAHTASVDFGVWVQDLLMKKGQLVETSGQFELPVWFAKNDTFDLERKGIDEYDFSFTLSGDVDAVNFVGVRLPGTASETWDVPFTKTGNTYKIHGKKLGSRSLFKIAPGNDTLVYLVFDAVKSEFTKDVLLSIDQNNGETVVYNNGTDRLINGQSAQARMPAPYGTLQGSRIVIVGTCAPKLESSAAPPSIVTLDQNSPNPFTGKTSFTFTVKADGYVELAIYDMLGKEVESVVNAILPQGRYEVSVDGSKYGTGTYVARLQANGSIRSRMIRVER